MNAIPDEPSEFDPIATQHERVVLGDGGKCGLLAVLLLLGVGMGLWDCGAW